MNNGHMFSLTGRVALVTGASRGLGFAMAKALKDNGASVVVNARNAKELDEAAAKIGAEAMAFDVTDSKVARTALEDIAKRHGKLDILVNNAGIQHRRPITEWEDEDFDRVIAVNLTSCFRLSRDAAGCRRHSPLCLLPLAACGRRPYSALMVTVPPP